MGLKGDLTAGEIVEQLVHARTVTHIKNVVFMVWTPIFSRECTARFVRRGQPLRRAQVSKRTSLCAQEKFARPCHVAHVWCLPAHWNGHSTRLICRCLFPAGHGGAAEQLRQTCERPSAS